MNAASPPPVTAAAIAPVADAEGCILCGASLERLTERKSTCFLACPRCGLMIGRSSAGKGDAVVETDPQHFKLLVEQYPAYRGVARRLIEARLPVYRRHLGRDPGYWLEIGPGNGALGEILPALGCEWIGVEFDADMASFMTQSGKCVVHADFAEVDPAALMTDEVRANGGFDIVSFSQVLEHVLRPRAFLANALAALRPGGLVHIDVPNGAGLTAAIRRLNPLSASYGEIVPPHHMIAYSARSLRTALEGAGFDIVDLFDCAYDHPVFGLVHSHMSASGKLRAVWKLSSIVGGGGNLVALARRPS